MDSTSTSPFKSTSRDNVKVDVKVFARTFPAFIDTLPVCDAVTSGAGRAARMWLDAGMTPEARAAIRLTQYARGGG